MWVSPRTTTLAYSPTSHLSFFITELKCSSFHRKQCNGKHARYSACSHTHICRHTHMSNIRLRPLETLGKSDQDNTLTEFVYLLSSLLCLCPLCLPLVNVCACVCVFAYMFAWHCEVHPRSPEGFWRAYCAYLRVCRCAEVYKPLLVYIYLCLVCLELYSITHLLCKSYVTKGP